MPVEMKSRHNLNLRDHDLWEIYRHADRVPIMEADPNFRFKKRNLSQVFGEMACNGLHYGILSNYTFSNGQKQNQEPYMFLMLFILIVSIQLYISVFTISVTLLLMIKLIED